MWFHVCLSGCLRGEFTAYRNRCDIRCLCAVVGVHICMIMCQHVWRAHVICACLLTCPNLSVAICVRRSLLLLRRLQNRALLHWQREAWTAGLIVVDNRPFWWMKVVNVRADVSQSWRTRPDISYDTALGGKTSTWTQMYLDLPVLRSSLCPHVIVKRRSSNQNVTVDTYIH